MVLREVFDSEVVDGEVSVVELEDFRVEFVDLKEAPDPPAVGIRGPVLGSAMSLGFWGFAPRGKTPELAARMDAALARVAGWFLKQPTAIGLLVSSRDGDYQVPTSPELIARLEAGRLDDLPGRADITDC